MSCTLWTDPPKIGLKYRPSICNDRVTLKVSTPRSTSAQPLDSPYISPERVEVTRWLPAVERLTALSTSAAVKLRGITIVLSGDLFSRARDKQLSIQHERSVAVMITYQAVFFVLFRYLSVLTALCLIVLSMPICPLRSSRKQGLG